MKNVFLIRVDPKQWQFKSRNRDWETINEGDWIPFNSDCRNKQDIKAMVAKDIILGYSCEPKKCIEALGRVVSGGPFSYLGEMRFLIQKTTKLERPVDLDSLRPVFENDSKLRINQPLVTLVNQDIWEKIKKMIIENNPEVANDIIKLEQENGDWKS